MKSPKFDKISSADRKRLKKCSSSTEQTVDRSELILKRNTKPNQTAVHVTILRRNGPNAWVYGRQNGECPLCRVAVRVSDTLLEHFFPLVWQVACEISFI